MPKNIIDKIWEQHVVRSAEWEPDLFFIDLHLIHEVTSPQAFTMLEDKWLPVFDPSSTFATVDHSIPTSPNRKDYSNEHTKNQVETLFKNVENHWITLFDDDSGKQWIVHIIWPERWLTQPGKTIVCGDSHTATHWAFWALAFWIGTTQVWHVLASQCLLLDKPKTMKVEFIWTPGKYFSPKDAILLLIQQIGIQWGTWYALEFTWKYIRDMSMEWRMTVCNMAIECWAKSGLISPDETTYKYLEWREYFENECRDTLDGYPECAESWKSVVSDNHAEYEKSITVDVTGINAVITWGTNPEQSIQVTWIVPWPDDYDDKAKSFACRKSLEYNKLKVWSQIAWTQIDYVFIWSCTNWRIEDFAIAANILKWKKIHSWVKAFFVPWSHEVRTLCDQKWYTQIFTDAWVDVRMSWCSMCLSMNWDIVPAGKRCISTSNRNFVWRQWVGSYTHLASPLMCSIACVTWKITDPEVYFSNNKK